MTVGYYRLPNVEITAGSRTLLGRAQYDGVHDPTVISEAFGSI